MTGFAQQLHSAHVGGMVLVFRTETRLARVLGAPVLGIAIAAVAACGGSSGNSATTVTQTVKETTSASTTPSPVASASVATNSAKPEDVRVCGTPDGLETRGIPFFKTLKVVLADGSMNSTVKEFRTQLLALATIGAPAGLTDGSEAIDQASFDVKQAMRHLVRDAEALIPKVVNDVPKEELNDVISSFTAALGACKDAGYTMNWPEVKK
jgi:hypothetical protein